MSENTLFENRVLRGIFGPERDEVTRDWRKLHNELLHNLYSLPDIIRTINKVDKMGRACCMHETRYAYKIMEKTLREETTWMT
jgi:hypothetical protein